MISQHELEIRVRYQETDAQGRVHHANYINYFEIGRVEMLRAAGQSYRQLEQDGVYLVVTELSCKYFLPAKYDDLLRLQTKLNSARGARIRHSYELFLDDCLLASGNSVVAAVDSSGKVVRLPKWLRTP